MGVILNDGKYYWKSENSQLNYELHEKVLCSGGVATDEILEDYDSLNDEE